MKYQLKTELFEDSFFDSSGKFKHKQGFFRLFPFITTPNSPVVEDLDNLKGRILCNIEGVKPNSITVSELIGKLQENTDIQPGDEKLCG